MPTLPPTWTPAGAAPWDVHRRWVTRLGRENFGRRARRRFTRSGSNLDVGSGCIDVDGIIAGIVILILVVLFVIFVAPLIFVAVEVLLLFVAVLLGLVAKIVFRRPWAIDAFGGDGTHLRWKEVGWRATTRKMDEVVTSLQRGVLLPGVELIHADTVAAAAPAPDWDRRDGPFGSGTGGG